MTEKQFVLDVKRLSENLLDYVTDVADLEEVYDLEEELAGFIRWTLEIPYSRQTKELLGKDEASRKHTLAIISSLLEDIVIAVGDYEANPDTVIYKLERILE
jgi:hypothetical protein